MRTATVKELKDELNHFSKEELIQICLRLSKFKKENKELLTYLLFEAHNEEGYIEHIKSEMDELFEQINTRRIYFIKKSIRKILRTIKKYIRYSQKKETEIEILIYFCQKLNDVEPSIHKNRVLKNLYDRQIESMSKTILKLHEDLQYDYNVELDSLR
jgi:hypothetical protein